MNDIAENTLDLRDNLSHNLALTVLLLRLLNSLVYHEVHLVANSARIETTTLLEVIDVGRLVEQGVLLLG